MSTRFSIKSPLFWAVVACVLAGGLFAFWKWRAEPVVSPPEEEAWLVQPVEGLAIETPFLFAPRPEMMSRLPPEARELVAAWNTSEGTTPSGEFRAQVSHVVFNEGVPVDLDGAAAGAIAETAAALGERAPKHIISPATVSGLEGRRASYRGHWDGRPLLLDAVLFRRGQEMWQVQTVSTAEAVRPAAERLLQSAKLAPGTEPAPPNPQ